MIQTKPKKCKGTVKAKGYGCGRVVLKRTYGLCGKCLSEWIEKTDEGKEFLTGHTLRAKRLTEKQKRSEIRVKKQEVKTLNELKKELQTEINRIVRLIDFDKNCISCNHGMDGFTRQAHAGHYHSVGSSPSIRFNIHNIHKQCSICNNFKSGALREYRQGLIKRGS